jgi:hypothetical protein
MQAGYGGNGGSPSIIFGAVRAGSSVYGCTNCFLAGVGYDGVLTGASTAPHGGSLTVYLRGVGKHGVGGKGKAKNRKDAPLTFGGGPAASASMKCSHWPKPVTAAP